MSDQMISNDSLVKENEELRTRLGAAEETLRAIRAHEVDALVVGTAGSEVVYTLRGADECYRTFVEVMHQGAATVSADGTILYCNRPMAALVDATHEATIGASIYDFVPPKDEGDMRALIWGALTDARVNEPFKLRTANGAAVPTIVTATPLAVDGVTCVCLVFADLTEHEARLAAESANRAKDRFLATLSHELRTPLTPVIMAVAEMQSNTSLPAQVHEDLAMVRRNIELETALIDDLLDVSRAVNGKLRLQMQPTSMHPLVQSVLEILRSDLRQKMLSLECDLGARVDLVKGDSARLQQILWNLVKNAIRFSNEGERITIRSWNTENGTFSIEIADQGVGIDRASLPAVFDAFVQGDRTDRRSGGLGLGLTIARALVEMHQGGIVAESDGLGQGAKFTITFPVASVDAGSVAQPTFQRTTPTSIRCLRILLVEDHQDTAAMLQRLLRASGHQVKAAGTVADALLLADSETFDIVISDIDLPDATGYDLMKEISARHEIPGVALSGYGMETDLSRSQAAGFKEHVTKPVSMSVLQAALDRASSHRNTTISAE